MVKQSDFINLECKKSNHYITLIDTCKTDCRQFFRYVEELDPKSPATSPSKLQVDNDTILTNTLDIATSLNECFSNIVSTYLPQANTSAPNYDKLIYRFQNPVPKFLMK